MNAVDKKTIKGRLSTALVAFLLGSWSLTPVYASDTEVYARLIEIDSADAAPTLMMMLDSSNFMNYCMNDTETNDNGLACADEFDSRIATLRRAMRKVLFGNPIPADGDIIKPAPGFLRMGYNRFMPSANDGAWVRYPALALDDLAPGESASTGFTNITTPIMRVSESAEDAICNFAAPATDPCITSTTPTTFVIKRGNPSFGLRFGNVNIPRGATINSATLTMVQQASSGSSPTYFVDPEVIGNAKKFTGGAASDTAAPMAERNYVNSATGYSALSISVKAQIQSIVDHSDWCGRNALSLRVRPTDSGGGNGSKTVYAYDGTTGNTTTDINRRPRLTINWTLNDPAKLSDTCARIALDSVSLVDSVYDDIEWTDGTTTVLPRNNTLKVGAIFDSSNNLVAARFDHLQIANNAMVEYAYLYSTLSSGETDTVEPVVKVQAIKQGNTPRFCDNTVKPVVCTVPSTGLTTAASTFTISNYTDGSGNPVSVGKNFVANVTPQVQEVVNLGAWSQGNTMAFVLQNNGTTSSLRGIASADSGLSKAMVLHVRALSEVKDLNNLRKTVRQDLYDDINSKMIAVGGTPLGDGYQEAARYLLGLTPTTQQPTATLTIEGVPTTFNTPDSRAISGGKYVSPLDRSGESCSAAYIFALSDGVPKNASNVTTNTKEILETAPTVSGLASCGDGITFPPDFSLTGTEKTNFQCMATLANYLYTKDLRDPSVVTDYKPIIRTNTVLFHGVPDDQLRIGLETVALMGGGKHYVATDEDTVLEAILETLRAVIEKTGSITAPGVAVNQFNRLTHLDQLYYAVFDPDQGNARWRGNVKRYRLKFTDTEALIVDKDDRPAIDSDTFFSDEAWSFWSPIKDGKNTSLGGVGSKLPAPASRIVYTSFPNYVLPSAGDVSLTPLDVSNATIVTNARTVMGVTTDNQAKNVINWLLGYDLTVVDPTDASRVKDAVIPTTGVGARNALGGVLHSQPVLVNYGYDSSYTANEAAADPDLQKNWLFFSTMEGMLHAVDVNSTSGVEKFAFMPREALEVADEQALNVPRDLPFFGLDLTWTVLRVDGNKDLQIEGNGESADADKVWLYGGMRMGGRNYYALNLTNLDEPKLKWVIEGGAAGPFAKLGQTWSKPVVGDVKINGVVKTVLFFAGGYDEKHEEEGFNAVTNASDDLGNQLYIVDPDTGEVLFWASGTGSGATLESADLKFSIPSEVKTFDSNKDGLVDALYVGDLGGQVLRLDIDNGTTSAAGLGKRVRLLASVGQSVTADSVNHRRFYEAPSVATMLDSTSKQTYAIVAMGTGYRSHPLNESTEDAFYVFRDNDVLRKDLLTADDLTLQDPITPTELASVNPASADPVNMTGKLGWQMYLPDDGEKIMATPILLFGEVFFTSYVPRQSLTSNKCSPVIGVTKLWRMTAFDAGVVRDINKDGVVDGADRFQDNLVEGLGGAPQLLVGEDGKNAIIAGTGVERNQDLNSANMRRTRWFEKSKR